MQQHTSLVDPELALRIRSLRVAARRAVDGMRSGLHKSPHRGASMIFAEHRDYRPGDDLRLLDWRAYARNDRYTIKRFEQEAHLRAHLVLDLSASMRYQGADAATQKARHAATLLAALALILLGQDDAVGASAFAHDLDLHLPARARSDHYDALLALLAQPPSGAAAPTSLEPALSRVFERLGRRGLVLLASDLLDLAPTALAPIARLTTRGHEVRVLHVLHPDELSFPFRDGMRFEDAEGPAFLEADAERLRAGYRRELRAFLESCRERCIAAGATYVLARTDEPAPRTLSRLLSRNGEDAWA